MANREVVYPIEPQLLIFLARRNADMTEGRGPMVNDKAFVTHHMACNYIDKQQGVMGRKGPFSNQPMGDWDVQTIPVYGRIPEPKEILRAQALSKLTKEEKEVLGL